MDVFLVDRDVNSRSKSPAMIDCPGAQMKFSPQKGSRVAPDMCNPQRDHARGTYTKLDGMI